MSHPACSHFPPHSQIFLLVLIGIADATVILAALYVTFIDKRAAAQNMGLAHGPPGGGRGGGGATTPPPPLSAYSPEGGRMREQALGLMAPLLGE